MYSRLPSAVQNKGVLIDANLLLALLVGLLGEGEVERFKRTRGQFTTRDVIELNKIIRKFGWICTTPQVIAEVSNLLDWLPDVKKDVANKLLAMYINTAKEFYVEAVEIIKTRVYYTLGITDAGLIILAKQKDCVVITADLPLYHYAINLKVNIINFNHIRDEWL